MQAACQPDDVEYGKVAKLVSPTPAEILAAVVLEAGIGFKFRAGFRVSGLLGFRLGFQIS